MRASCLSLALFLAACAGEATPIQQPEAMPDANPITYPVAMWDSRLEGETVLMLHVSERGMVDSAFVQETSGHAEFDSAAVQGGRRLRFTPGRQGDHSVAMWTRLPVRFALDSTATLGIPVAPDSTP